MRWMGWGLVLVCLVGAKADTPHYVTGSVGRLRAAPQKKAKVIAPLRVGTELRVEGKAKDGFVKARTEVWSGYIKKSLVSTTAPDFDALMKTAASSRGRRQKNALLRAVGLRPANEKAIAQLTAMFAARKNEKAAHMAEKGLIAAERRNLSWDGPLYPIIGGRAYLPLPCPAGELAPSEDRTTLRGRAFPLVASGKVVSVTERGYTTQTLSTPVCAGGQLAFDLPKPVVDGALVPSWTVAGFLVVPFEKRDGGFVDAQGLFSVRIDEHTMFLSRQGFDGQPALIAQQQSERFRGAVPVAQYTEDEQTVHVLFVRDHAPRACGVPAERHAFVVRVRYRGPRLTVDEGRVYVSHLVEGCAQPVFEGLEGEPRCARLPEGCELADPKLSYPAWLTRDASAHAAASHH